MADSTAELAYLSISEAAALIERRQLSPLDLVSSALDRISQLNPITHAFYTVLEGEAMTAAAEAESAIASGRHLGPLHGLPIGVKDVINHGRTTAGSKSLSGNYASESATVVRRLEDAGAIIIGKTATYEFAVGRPTPDSFFPAARNPWALDRDPGGSSSGSAVAVAAGMVPGAVGTDTGGSVRYPASACGVVGIKPTYGLVSRAGVLPNSYSYDHCGPMARTAEDCALIFDAIAQYDPRDPNSVSGPPARASASLIGGAEGRSPLSLQGITLGVPPESFVAPLDPEVRAAWRAALLVFQEEGAEVVDVDVPLPSMSMYRNIQRPEATLAHIQQGWFHARAADYTAGVREVLLKGQQIPAVDYLQAQYERRIFSSTVRTAMQRVNALVLPTMPIPAITVDEIDQQISIDGVPEESTAALLRLTRAFNLSGLPAISLPCGFTTNGLPIGLQLAGKPFEEAMILRIAHAYQQLTDWHRREIGTKA